MANPWDSDPIVGAAPSGPVYGAPVAPKEATPQTPAQQANTEVNAAQGRQSMQLTPPKTAGDFIKDFSADPAVKAYREVLPQVIAATQAGHNGAGDSSVVYGWAKAMDPTGSVREGDTDMAQATAGPMQRAQFLVSQYHLESGGTLPPSVRQGLIEEMRNKGRQLDLQYSDKYRQYQQLLQQAHLDPGLLGPHEGDKYRAAEEGYVRSVNGANQGPTDPSFVALHGGQPQGEGQFGPAPHEQPLPAGAEKIPGELAQALKSGAIPPDPYAIMGWAKEHGGYTISLDEAKRAADSAKKGAFPGAVVDPYKPDISDVRGGNNTGTQDAFNAGVRGFGDTLSLGLLDKGAALVDTIKKPGSSFDQNLQRQYAITDFDAAQHPFARGVGEVGGGALLPMGEVGSVANLALKGAGYGAAYGAGSSRSISDVPMNALLGGAAGGATAGTIGLAGKAFNALRSGAKSAVPPLVDPVTGRLNEPLEQAGSAGRVDAARQFGIDLPMGSAGDRTAAIIEKKLDVRPSSAGVMNDSRRAVEGQVQDAAEGVANKFGSARTLNEAGGELQRGANEYIDRAKAITSKAYDAIPISPKAPASTTSTVATLTDLTSRFASNPELQQQVGSKQLTGFLDAIKSKGVSWEDMKSLRSFIGERIGERRFTDDAATSDLRAVYGALSEDMKNTAAAMGPRATAAFNRANSLYRETQQRIDNSLVSLLGNDAAKSPEAAAKAVQNMTMGGKGTGDLRKLAQIKAATVKSGAWDEVAGALIRIGGQPADSPGRGFDPGVFVRWYSDMAEPARSMLFKPELRKSLDQFVQVNQRLANSNALRNTSNTAMGSPTGTFAIPSAVAVAASGHPFAALGLIAGAGVKMGAEFGIANLWTSPKFVQWATGYSKAAASGSLGAIKSQVGRLQKLAVTNPELRAGIEHLMKAIANDNAPKVGQLAASPNQGPDQQGQPQ